MRPRQAPRHDRTSFGHLGSAVADRVRPDACPGPAYQRSAAALGESAMSALMYHDIVDARAADSSGFAGRDAALYKVAPAVFEDHLDAILRLLARAAPPHGFEPTFDDGGRAALTAADSLEKRGLRGSFFITVNYIGTRGFVSKSQLIELRRRGHRIGSHSCSHPLRMGHCEWPRLIHE